MTRIAYTILTADLLNLDGVTDDDVDAYETALIVELEREFPGAEVDVGRMNYITGLSPVRVESDDGNEDDIARRVREIANRTFASVLA